MEFRADGIGRRAVRHRKLSQGNQPSAREWAERLYNVQRWTKMPRGGHFAASEEPDLLVEDIREFFRPLR
ncbi:MAG: hypothetical protein IIB14_07315 [Chloroflexi bacterium]|nr:hypothetical protein [Chloroflexota bacterium]